MTQCNDSQGFPVSPVMPFECCVTPLLCTCVACNAQCTQGFPVSPVTAFEWSKGAPLILEQQQQGGGLNPGASSSACALVDGQGLGPGPGQLWKNPDLGATYRRVAQHGAAKGGLCRCWKHLTSARGGGGDKSTGVDAPTLTAITRAGVVCRQHSTTLGPGSCRGHLGMV